MVIPTRDRGALLPRAVRSALGQSVADLEVVIVDDGSAVAVHLEPRDPRVRILRLERTAGVSAARNHGLRWARGRWTVFLDDDDELLPDMVLISRAAALASARPAPVAVLSGIAVVSDAGALLEERFPISLDRGGSYFAAGDPRYLQDANTLFAPTDVLRAIGGWNESFRGWEIDDLFLRLSQASSIEGVARVTYRMHHHDGPRLSRDAWSMIGGLERTLREHRDAFAACPERHATYLARLGALYLDAGDWRRAISALGVSLRLDPLAPRAWPRFLLGLGGPRAYRLYRSARRWMAQR